MTPEEKTIKAFEESEFPINPPLPDGFDVTPNDERPEWQLDHLWDRPYIQIDDYSNESEHDDVNKNWIEAWSTGKRYASRCLDGGAWDRSTNWGMFATLEEAIECCKTGPSWRK